jgi:hypothetical protein
MLGEILIYWLTGSGRQSMRFPTGPPLRQQPRYRVARKPLLN